MSKLKTANNAPAENLLDQIFEGTNNMMEKIFGSSKPSASRTRVPEVHLSIKKPQMARLLAGEQIKYRADGHLLVLVAPAKYSREEIADLLKRGSITGDQAEIMLRERA